LRPLVGKFATGRLVFDDLFALDRLDIDCEAVEARYIITRMVNGALLTVVYTERGGRARIVAAGKATQHKQTNRYRGQTAE
jgi:uncharacterized protein